MEITITKAVTGDIDILMEWRMEVLAEVFSLGPEADRGALERANRLYYQRSLPDESHIACLVYGEDGIVGCGGLCIYQEMPSPDNPAGFCGYLMNIYTRPLFRHRGIGRKTVQWLVEQAEERGITKIYLETSDPARSMYVDMGFKAMPNQMQLE